MNQMYKALEEIGLTNGEIKVYVTLIKIGESTTGKIVKVSKLSSGKMYQILDKLIDKGLVTYILKNKIKYFSAADPNKLLEYLDKKKSEIESKTREVKDFLPELISWGKSNVKQYSAVIYEGLQGFRTAIFETLEGLDSKDEWLALGVGNKSPDVVNKIWYQFNNIRSQKKIKSLIITANEEVYNEYIEMPFAEIRYLEHIGTVPISIAKDVVIIYNWEDLSIIKITNKNVAQSFRDFFYSLWKIAKK